MLAAMGVRIGVFEQRSVSVNNKRRRVRACRVVSVDQRTRYACSQNVKAPVGNRELVADCPDVEHMFLHGRSGEAFTSGSNRAEQSQCRGAHMAGTSPRGQ